MLDDPLVESVEVNGAEHIYVIRDGQRERAMQRFSCQQALALAIDRLVRATGQTGRTGTQTEGTLPDGTSMFVVWPPVCPAGPAMVLRKPRSEAPSLQALVDRGTVTADAAAVLTRLVQAKRSVAITGLGGLGKRTVLNALAQLVDPLSRLVVVEDGQRLRLDQAQVVRIDAVGPPEGRVSPLHIARRLRPDWLLMGDASGVQLHELFAVTADGMPPWLATFVARDAHDFLDRVHHALLMGHPGLPEAVAKARALRGLDAVAVFVSDGRGGGSLREVYEVLRHGAAGDELAPLTADAVQTR
jgi:pilus assembly protein CpaF